MPNFRIAILNCGWSQFPNMITWRNLPLVIFLILAAGRKVSLGEKCLAKVG